MKELYLEERISIVRRALNEKSMYFSGCLADKILMTAASEADEDFRFDL